MQWIRVINPKFQEQTYTHHYADVVYFLHILSTTMPSVQIRTLDIACPHVSRYGSDGIYTRLTFKTIKNLFVLIIDVDKSKCSTIYAECSFVWCNRRETQLTNYEGIHKVISFIREHKHV